MKNIRTLFLTVTAVIMLSFCASAKVGDVIGNIYSTDILTYVDGAVIPSYSINGEMLIIAEDLASYGFTVTYDDSIRTLFANYTAKEPSGIKAVSKGQVGEIVGNYYESDIKVLINGRYASAYSLNGKMAIKAEELGAFDEYGWYYDYGFSDKLMKCVWNEEERKLNLYNHLWVFSDVDKFKEEYKEGRKDDFLWFYDSEIKLSDATLLIGGQSGTTHGTYYNYQYITDDGKCVINLNGIFDAYQFNDIWGHIRIENLRADGASILFDGIKKDGREGTYSLNPKTAVLTVIKESEPNKNKASQMFFNEAQ